MLARLVGRAMPDENGRLTPEDHEKIRRWWLSNENWRAPVTCPVCKTDQWAVWDHVTVMTRHSLNGDLIGSPAYPLVGVCCKHCTHTIFFSAVAMGVAIHYDPTGDPIVLAALPSPSGSGS